MDRPETFDHRPRLHPVAGLAPGCSVCGSPSGTGGPCVSGVDVGAAVVDGGRLHSGAACQTHAMSLMTVVVSPDPDDSRAVQAWVDVTVDGSPLRMLLDTGSGRSAIPASTLPKTEAPQSSSGRGVSGSESMNQRGQVGCLSLPGAHSCPGLVVDVLPDGWAHPALLGRDVLQGHTCDFRFTDGTIEIDPNSPPASLRVCGPEDETRALAVTIRWPNSEVTAVWDTGAGIAIVDRSWALDHPDAVAFTDIGGEGTDATGTAVTGVHGTLAAYTIAGIDFPEQPCGIVDLSSLNAQMTEPIRVIFGLPQIVQANWYLDASSATLSIYPKTDDRPGTAAR